MWIFRGIPVGGPLYRTLSVLKEGKHDRHSLKIRPCLHNAHSSRMSALKWHSDCETPQGCVLVI